MKERGKIPFLVLMIFFIASACMAHPPAEVKLEYHAETQILSMNILHPTPDIQKHFIEEIIVMLNGKELVKQLFNTQMQAEGHKAICMVYGAKPGDEIVVIAKCNVFGKKKVSYIIPEGKKS